MYAFREAAEFAFRCAALPLACFLGFWVLAQCWLGKQASRGRQSNSLLWTAGIFLLVAGMQPWCSNTAARVVAEYHSCVWLAGSIGLCLLAMRLRRKVVVAGVVMILIAMGLLIWQAREWCRYW